MPLLLRLLSTSSHKIRLCVFSHINEKTKSLLNYQTLILKSEQKSTQNTNYLTLFYFQMGQKYASPQVGSKITI